MTHAIHQCKLIIANSSDVTTPTELFALYDVADAYCNRDVVGDELADEVYYHLAIACERLGLDPLAF